MGSLIIGGTCGECRYWRQLDAAPSADLPAGQCMMMESAGGIPFHRESGAVAYRPLKTGDHAGEPDGAAECYVATARSFGCAMFAFKESEAS